MPGEVKDPTSLHWKCVTCRGLHRPLLETTRHHGPHFRVLSYEHDVFQIKSKMITSYNNTARKSALPPLYPGLPIRIIDKPLLMTLTQLQVSLQQEKEMKKRRKE